MMEVRVTVSAILHLLEIPDTGIRARTNRSKFLVQSGGYKLEKRMV
jgi:hypothetical protein